MNGKKIVGWLVCDRIATEMNVRQKYAVKHIWNGLTFLTHCVRINIAA